MCQSKEFEGFVDGFFDVSLKVRKEARKTGLKEKTTKIDVHR